jgi:hypothetical protein
MSSRTIKPDSHQFEMTWLFPHLKETVRPDEVALVCSMSVDQVAAHVECGNFVAVPINDQPTSERQGAKRREHRRIMRFSVEAWWLNRLAEQGVTMPVQETPQIKWWREELRKKGKS